MLSTLECSLLPPSSHQQHPRQSALSASSAALLLDVADVSSSSSSCCGGESDAFYASSLSLSPASPPHSQASQGPTPFGLTTPPPSCATAVNSPEFMMAPKGQDEVMASSGNRGFMAGSGSPNPNPPQVHCVSPSLEAFQPFMVDPSMDPPPSAPQQYLNQQPIVYGNVLHGGNSVHPGAVYPKPPVAVAAVAGATARSKAVDMAEIRRLRHLEIVRKGRLKKKQSMEKMRKQVEELEAQMKALMAAKDAQQPSHAAASQALALVNQRDRDDGLVFQNDLHVSTKATAARLHQAYQSMMNETCRLRDENGAIKQQILQLETLGEQFKRFVKDFQVMEMDPRAMFDEVPRSRIFEIRRRALLEGDAFFRKIENARPRDQRRMDMGTWGWEEAARGKDPSQTSVEFHFSKTLTTIGVERLMQKSWEMYTHLEDYRGIYASTQKLDVLQCIDQDTLVIRRDLYSHSVVFRTIFMLSRIRLEDGYMICFCSCNPDSPIECRSEEGVPVQWLNIYYWLRLTHAQDGSGGCDVKFGGHVLNGNSMVYANYWAFEILFAAVRWESNAVTPMICS